MKFKFYGAKKIYADKGKSPIQVYKNGKWTQMKIDDEPFGLWTGKPLTEFFVKGGWAYFRVVQGSRDYRFKVTDCDFTIY